MTEAGRQPPHHHDVAWIIAAAALTFLGLLQMVSDFDTPWHMATGEWILEHGAIPQHDIFTFSHQGQPWSNHSAGFQLLLALCVRLLGVAGATVLPALLGAALSVFLVLSVRKRTIAPLALVATATMVTILACNHALVARPQITSFAGLALSLALASRLVRRPSLWPCVVALVVHVVWLYCHATHVMLPAVFVACAAFAAVHRSFRLAALALGTAAGAMALTMLLAPDTLATLTTHSSSEFARSSLGEWQKLSFRVLLGAPLGWFFCVAILAACVGAVRRVRSGDRDLSVRFESVLLLIAVLLLPFAVTRVVPLYLLGLAPLWMPAALDVTTELGQALGKRFPLRRSLVAVSIAAIGLSLAGTQLLASGGRPGFGFDRKRFPSDTVTSLASESDPVRLFNSYNFGGYLIWRRTPTSGVLVDSRGQTLYSDEFLFRLDEAYRDGDAFDSFVDEWQFTHVLVPKDSARTRPLIQRLLRSPTWLRQSHDQVAILFRRRPPN
jgi:hypothetical protein